MAIETVELGTVTGEVYNTNNPDVVRLEPYENVVLVFQQPIQIYEGDSETPTPYNALLVIPFTQVAYLKQIKKAS